MEVRIENEEAMSEIETYYWIVQLISGNPERGGIVVETQLVTKKWERVEGQVEVWEQHIQTGEYYAHVMAVRGVADAFFTKS